MTGEGLAGDRVADQLGGPSAPPGRSEILEICDGLLKEVGRRSHRFAWLRPPGAGSEEWLVVDAYYPGHRLVVICREAEAELEALYAELVPAHGLRLLRLIPSSLPRSRADAKHELGLRIETLVPEPRSTALAEARGTGRDRVRVKDLHGPVGPMARVAGSLAQAGSSARAGAPADPRHRPLGPAQTAAAERAARFVQARRLNQAPPAPPQRTLTIPSTRRAALARPPVRTRSAPAVVTPTQIVLAGLALAAIVIAISLLALLLAG